MGMKKIFVMAMIVSVLLIFNSNSVFAVENEGVSLEPPKLWFEDEGGMTTRGTEPPPKDYLYENNQYVSFKGSADISSLFTDNCFHNIYQITCMVTNNSDNDLEVTLCYHKFLGEYYSEDKIFTVPANSSRTLYFRDLNIKLYYFLRFSAPCDFSGRALGFAQ